MIDAKVYNQSGETSGTINLPENIFGVQWNADLVHQVVVSQAANERVPVAHALGRGEVRGGGRKPWKQKGTGRARHGSTRSPIWRHGGKAHGPNKETDFSKKINSKMRNKALFAVLSAKLKDKEIFFLDNVKLGAAKTKQAAAILSALSKKLDKKEMNYKAGKRVLIALPGRDEGTERSFQNIKSALVEETRNLNPRSAMTYKYIMFVNPEESIKILSSRIKEGAAKK